MGLEGRSVTTQFGRARLAAAPLVGAGFASAGAWGVASGASSGSTRPRLALPSASISIVVPGGRTWVATYHLLTGIHFLHVIVAVVLLGQALPKHLASAVAVSVERAAPFWQLVVGVWVFLFLMFYTHFIVISLVLTIIKMSW